MTDKHESRSVVRAAYEVVGAGIPVAEAFYAKRDGALSAQREIVLSLGATAYEVTRDGRVGALVFDKTPKGFRKTGVRGGGVACEPSRTTDLGKEIAARLSKAPRAEPEAALADLLLPPETEFLIDAAGSIHFRTASRLTLPTVRYFVNAAHPEDGKPQVPDTLREIRNSEYVAAFEDHNEEVRRRRRAEAA